MGSSNLIAFNRNRLFRLRPTLGADVFLRGHSYYQPSLSCPPGRAGARVLAETGSSNPLGLDRNFDKRPFHPYFSVKDVFGFIIFFLLLTFLCLQAPWDLGDPENFIPANPMVTPVHIQPE